MGGARVAPGMNLQENHGATTLVQATPTMKGTNALILNTAREEKV